MRKWICCLLFLPTLSFAAELRGDWSAQVNRVWIGPDYWANPMEDWRITNGRLECLRGGGSRNVQALTVDLAVANDPFLIQVMVGQRPETKGAGAAGIRFGIQDELPNPLSRLFKGRGTEAGIATDGTLFIGNKTTQVNALKSAVKSQVLLDLKGFPNGKNVDLLLSARDADGKELGSLRSVAPAEALAGNLALFNNRQGGSAKKGKGKNQGGSATFWFKAWSISGKRVAAHPDRAFGPVLFAMHSLSRGEMKMTAQMPPVGPKDSQAVHLEFKDGKGWKRVKTAAIDPIARTARFQVLDWIAHQDMPYRLVYRFDGKDHILEGTVRQEPQGREVKVAGFTGNTDPGFPNAELARNVMIQDPDVLVFTGDQLYESVGGYGIHRQPVDVAVLNYLRKWYMFGWAFRDLMKDRVSICLPDDHDVYQGNIWGQGGRATTMAMHDAGGYAMHEDFVNAVHRTQTSHHPEPYDPTPIDRGISVYYGDMVYGRVSFAVIADRMFKSGPKGKVPPTGGRADHVRDPNFDTTSVDVEGLVLLGERQETFLREWTADWKGADMKMVLSQTIFANVANFHGGNQQYLVADLDSNGWPQSGRNRALREMRKGFPLHLAGDQHLASIVHHGVDGWNDAVYSFCVPSIAAGYPRSWRPEEPGRNALPGKPHTGEFKDGLGNKITVYAVGNPAKENRPGRLNTLHDKASGYGLVHVDTEKQTYRMECWRLLFDAENPKPEDQFPGWPKTISIEENYPFPRLGKLPEILFQGLGNPIVQVIDEKTKEVVYTRRVKGRSYAPPVPGNGPYTVIVGDQDEVEKVLKGLRVNPEAKPIDVNTYKGAP